MGYWRNCVDDSQCQRPFTCWNNRCACPVGRLWNEPFCENFNSSRCDKYFGIGDFRCRERDDNRICDEKSTQCICRQQTVEDANDRFCKLVHAQCKSDLDCQVNDANSSCDQTDGRCKCLPNYYYDFNFELCQPKLNYHNECDYHYQCKGGMLCQRLIWDSYGRCRCPFGWRFSDVAKICQPIASTINCTVDEECRNSTTNKAEICVNGTCQCPHGHRLDSFGNCTVGASRYKECQVITDCQANMTCDFTSTSFIGFCRCDWGYQWSKEDRKCLLFNDTLCDSEWDCSHKEVFLTCTNQTCTCKENRELTEDGRCLLKMPACQNNAECPTYSGKDTFCNQDLKKNQCTCSQNKYLDKYFCMSKRCNVEHPCHSDDYSNDGNVYCYVDAFNIFGFCECRHGFDETGRCNDPPIHKILGLSPVVFYIIVSVIAVLVVSGVVYLLVRKHLNAKCR